MLTLLLLILTGAILFATPLRYKTWAALAIVTCFAVAGTTLAIGTLADTQSAYSLQTTFFAGEEMHIDMLSALFLIVIAIGSIAAVLYARGYLQHYIGHKSAAHFSLHYYALTLLAISMMAVVCANGGYTFLFWWELMTLSSFVLILFDAERKEVLKAALSYLVMMHIGFFALLIAVVQLQVAEGITDFEALAPYFATHKALPIWTVFLVGFGMKAGMFPLHIWLPEAHPAAPSHVSALMSGVMIKTGVYGILRVSMYLPAGEVMESAGIVLLVIGAVTGLWGILQATIQNDIKRLLAYSSIENIGIIFIGMGIALLGRSSANYPMALCGTIGALLHTVNHSFFKSLLFFGAGNLYSEEHTTTLDRFGGVIRQMPITALLFLIGTVAICALPPLNGFVSEFILYVGMFQGVASSDHALYAVLGIAALALIGGLAIYAFTKLYGVAFLGSPRSHEVAEMQEVDNGRIVAMALPVVGILCIGFAPTLLLSLFAKVAATLIPEMGYLWTEEVVGETLSSSLQQVGIVAGVVVVLTLMLLYLKQRALRNRTVGQGTTWGCGFAATNDRMQYTGESFAEGLESILQPLTQEVVQGEAVDKREIFPSSHDFKIHHKDRIDKLFTAWWVELIRLINARVMRLRTGKINHYILFALLFIILVFLCSILNIFQ
jgi:formate hydrogenlyase subunit 3/multisubunit Na+/H+ antiporter MnhD subunit